MALAQIPIQVALLIASLFGLVTAQTFNPNIANGTCYSSVGNKAPAGFIPCGNAALAHFSCCWEGDKCLSNNACFGFNGYTTYLAGCTDSSYSDEVCPNKGEFVDNTWAGLVYCNGSSNEWIACNETGLDPGPGAPCSCAPDSRTVAFAAPSTLQNWASLPGTSDGSIMWLEGHTTITVTSSSSFARSNSTSPALTSSTSNDSTSSITLPAISVTAPRPSDMTSGPTYTSTGNIPGGPPTISQTLKDLSTGATVGISIGATIGAILFIALLWLLAARIRRQRSIAIPTDSQIRPRSQGFEKEPDEFDPRSPSWPSYKSELPAEERNSVISPASTQQEWNRPTSAEVKGSIPTLQSGGSLRSQALGDEAVVYQPYRRSESGKIGEQGSPRRGGASRQVKEGVYEMP